MGKTEKPKSSWRERRKDIKHKWLRPLIYVEWRCERLSYLLGRWAFLEILGHVGRFSILASVVVGIGVYWWESDERSMQAEAKRMQAEDQRKAKHYQAWQVINAAHGKPGSGGRIEALQDLNKDKVSLRSVDLSNANLKGIDLKKADLADANLSGADIGDANLSGAFLGGANLSGASLWEANLSEAVLQVANLCGADMYRGNFSGANLIHANLSLADLWETNLSGADLRRANLSGADLFDANLSGAFLGGANLSGANLRYANLSGADLEVADLLNIQEWKGVRSIEFANIYDVNNPPDGFIEWAKENGAVAIKDELKWKALMEKERGRHRQIKNQGEKGKNTPKG